MPHMITPECIKDDFIILDSNKEGIASMMLPLNLTSKPYKCKLQVIADEFGDVPVIKDIIYRSPVAHPMGAFQVEVSIYIAQEDELITFGEKYSLDTLVSLVSFVEAKDMSIRWDFN